MSEYRKTSPDELYFITLTVTGWTDLFTRSVYKDIVIDNLRYCQENENLVIYSYVIMSNHLHLICRRKGKDLKELLGRFKGYTSKQLLKEIQTNAQESRKERLLHQFNFFAKRNKQYSQYHLWQYKDHPILLFTPEVTQQKQIYIHENPVKAGIVNDATAYGYSSACLDSPLQVSDLF
ncbi:MAG: transposase [Flavobacteriales bacterium]|nr:transposase [Flavobacteriales bacterium]